MRRVEPNARDAGETTSGRWFAPAERSAASPLSLQFLKRLTREIKVAQLAGYVAEKSAYHHGEAALTSTIVWMAQSFVGSNNVNLLYPGGMFGMRLAGGKDAASARYIFTNLCPIARTLFPPLDDPILTYLNDDGLDIEPEYYLRCIPMVLVNGSSGIGTGWSSSIPNYNPRDLVAALCARIIHCLSLAPALVLLSPVDSRPGAAPYAG